MPGHRIVVVGASLAGVHAAEELRAAGYDGDVVLLGAEEGLPYDRPPLSKKFLAGPAAEETLLRSPEQFAELGIELVAGHRAIGLDTVRQRIALAEGEAVEYDGLVIATGSRARRPRFLDGLGGVHTLRTLQDARSLRAAFTGSPRVAVLGGGFIGAEVAATARGLGLDVTLVEALETPLAASLGPTIGGVLAAAHNDRGVQVACGVPLDRVEGDGRVERLVLADGTRIDADLLVVGVGAEPVTDWLRTSGLALRDGVLCDSYCATAVPRIMAAGDVARWQHPRLGEVRAEHHANAVEQGAAAARNLLASPAERQPYAPVGYVWSDQYEHRLQIIGTCRPSDELVIVHGSLEARAFVACYLRDGQISGAVGLDARRQLMRMRPLIDAGADREALLAAVGPAPAAANG
ncbi:FAD-dependent oxidoreductase [Streptomyces atratus]|uniref:NAD(P)/FAD-dependent oxidoreductase n=1 Tax=Streptomyces atratus TaxID=1893 RepID=UPI001670CE6D|nr:FAD-dependent oxidoreductase [Streptomyces atratus]WPW26320.1 FAD-dependent oxidoreductase [Streptomyces atratus]GGT65946.1 pyridine nucleotide-disulfide oxidoreductase [Streptomyces atratus]